MSVGKWFAKLTPPNPRVQREREPAAELLRRGAEYQNGGNSGEAEECYRQALALQPENAQAVHRLARILAAKGNARQERGEFEPAIEDYEESLALEQGQAQVLNNLGNLYKDSGRLEDAIAAYRSAIDADGSLAEAHLNLGTALFQAGESAQAIAHCRSALALRPSFAEASVSLGYLLEREGDAPGAAASYRDAIAARPDFAEAHFNYALQLLLAGDFEKGWGEYEWRLRLPELAPLWPHAGRPRWDGSPLEGKAILLYAEQGFGDAIQFVRFAPLVAERGGRVILSCASSLMALFENVPGVAATADRSKPAPAFDLCCSLLSLPGIFGTTIATLPARTPYLHANPETMRRWNARLAPDAASLKVGLVWATRSSNKSAQSRSLDRATLAPLAAAGDVLFCSLQVGPGAGPAAHAPAGMRIVDFGRELADFSDTAALIANLDLVISIDTAVAHLAGAMAKPVWVLTDWPPEWRWLLGRDDSPWYPTMRLFRRGRAEPWQSVISRAADALRALDRRRSP